MPRRPGRFRLRLLGAACLIGTLAACGASSPSPTTVETVPPARSILRPRLRRADDRDPRNQHRSLH